MVFIPVSTVVGKLIGGALFVGISIACDIDWNEYKSNKEILASINFFLESMGKPCLLKIIIFSMSISKITICVLNLCVHLPYDFVL